MPFLSQGSKISLCFGDTQMKKHNSNYFKSVWFYEKILEIGHIPLVCLQEEEGEKENIYYSDDNNNNNTKRSTCLLYTSRCV